MRWHDSAFHCPSHELVQVKMESMRSCSSSCHVPTSYRLASLQRRAPSPHWCRTRRLPSGKPHSQLTCDRSPASRSPPEPFSLAQRPFCSAIDYAYSSYCLANTFLFDIDFANCFLFGIHFYRSASVCQSLQVFAKQSGLFGKQ